MNRENKRKGDWSTANPWAVLLVSSLIGSLVLGIAHLSTVKLGFGLVRPSGATESYELTVADLLAQQEMADWAFWMVMLTATSVVASVTGFAFIYASLTATREATQVANDQLEHSRQALLTTERAYLHYNGLRWISHPGQDGKIFWRLWFIWENVGNTPALGVKTMVSSELTADLIDATFVLPSVEDFGEGTVVPPKSTIRSGPIDVASNSIRRTNGPPIAFVGVATYRDVFENSPAHQSSFAIYLNGYTGDPERPFDDKENVVHLQFANAAFLNRSN